jgi:hypothetical protein
VTDGTDPATRKLWVLDCQILLILSERNEEDTGALTRPILDQGLREPAAEVFQDAVMVVEPALQFGASGRARQSAGGSVHP